MSKKYGKTTKKHSYYNGGQNDENLSNINTPMSTTSDIESEIDPIESDVNYKIQSIQCMDLRDFNDFFNKDLKMRNTSGDPTTNIIDRQFLKCYNVPDKKIHLMFKYMEVCRKNNRRLMFTEKQQPYSGIMLDFDIYQDKEENQLNDEIFHVLCQKIIELLLKIIKINEKKIVIHIGITRKPKITVNEEKDCYKDGFHIILPGVKVVRGVKRLLINKLIENELIDQIMCDVNPANIKIKGVEYQRKDFLDINSSHVPVFFIGSSTKNGSPPYQLTHIFEVKINNETSTIILNRCEHQFKKPNINICNEFSLNYEASPALINKKNYECLEKYANEVADYENKNQIDEKLIQNYGVLSTNSIHDVQIKEIKDLLDTLHPKRADDYDTWRDVIFALSNTSISYKDLAEYFTRKSSKPSRMRKLEELWQSAIRGTKGNKCALSIGSIHYWAKSDNPERYQQLRKQSVYTVLYNMVYEGYKEGLLSHSDIAKLLHILLQHKYVTDVPEEESKVYWYEFILDDDDHIDGELYKWYKWKTLPTSLDRYISEVLPNLFEMVFINVKKNFEKSTGDINKYYNKVLQNFKATMRKLGDRFFKKNVIEEAAVKFSKRGFDYSLDKNPLIRGVQNGVLKMSHVPGGKPLLIQGYHTHPISKYTKVPYIPFNPYDPLTKKILIALRNLFPDNEPDSFEFYMSYLSSTADGNPKESMFMMMVGKGSNGKTFSVELHKSAIGDIYGVKMPLSYLTAKDSNPENATPVEVMLKDATFAYYSESNKNEVLNAAKIKRVTGLETLGGRKLNCNYMMFKPKCHHLVTTNFDFDVLCDDHGTWRRIVYVPLKMTFVDTSTEVFDPNDPNQRIADSTLAQGWTEDPEVQGRYYGIMIWYNYWLYRKYKGKVKSVPHPHIQYETEKYRRRQNALSAFLAQRFVKLADKNYQSPMTEEIQKYIKWYTVNYGNSIPAKGVITLFQNSQIGKHIITTQRGIFMKGYKFLDNAEQLNEGEEYAMKNVFDIDVPEDNFGIEPETPDQFYSRICSEYDQYKNIFDGKPVYDIDPDNLVKEDSDVNIGVNIPQKNVRKSNIEIDGRILPSGIVLRVLEEPNIKYNNNFDMKKYMPVNSDNESDLEVEDEEIEVESEKSEVESEKSEEENEKSEEESQEESDAESDAESEVNTSVESDAESDVDDPDYFPNIGVDNSSLFKSKKHK